MVEPRIVQRADHPISRKDIDHDALKVLYRLREANYTAYLVGGSVRDLLLARRPKDFDIGTSAHPSQVKKLFRNCWVIGRRFRLAHVKFGNKVIEVATFRRQVQAGEEIVQDGVPAPDPTTPEGEHLIHHDNTFGTPEEDAFRRDFTLNALFYDIATFSIIDYVGGLDDVRAGLIRCIGDPDVRFREDPVRMLRAIALASRLNFTIDPPVLDAIGRHRQEIGQSSAPRLLEEYYKILRAGEAEKTFRWLAELGLLEPTAAELHHGADEALWQSLAAVDAYREQFDATPDTLTNAILMGSFLVPLGISLNPGRSDNAKKPSIPRLGELPLARRDVERLRLILSLQRRLHDTTANVRAQHGMAQRPMFKDALTWLEIHGERPELVEHWKAILAEVRAAGPEEGATPEGAEAAEGSADPFKRRRRRRRRRSPRPPEH